MGDTKWNCFIAGKHERRSLRCILGDVEIFHIDLFNNITKEWDFHVFSRMMRSLCMSRDAFKRITLTEFSWDAFSSIIVNWGVCHPHYPVHFLAFHLWGFICNIYYSIHQFNCNRNVRYVVRLLIMIVNLPTRDISHIFSSILIIVSWFWNTRLLL